MFDTTKFDTTGSNKTKSDIDYTSVPVRVQMMRILLHLNMQGDITVHLTGARLLSLHESYLTEEPDIMQNVEDAIGKDVKTYLVAIEETKKEGYQPTDEELEHYIGIFFARTMLQRDMLFMPFLDNVLFGEFRNDFAKIELFVQFLEFCHRVDDAVNSPQDFLNSSFNVVSSKSE